MRRRTPRCHGRASLTSRVLQPHTVFIAASSIRPRAGCVLEAAALQRPPAREPGPAPARRVSWAQCGRRLGIAGRPAVALRCRERAPLQRVAPAQRVGQDRLRATGRGGAARMAGRVPAAAGGRRRDRVVPLWPRMVRGAPAGAAGRSAGRASVARPGRLRGLPGVACPLAAPTSACRRRSSRRHERRACRGARAEPVCACSAGFWPRPAAAARWGAGSQCAVRGRAFAEPQRRLRALHSAAVRRRSPALDARQRLQRRAPAPCCHGAGSTAAVLDIC